MKKSIIFFDIDGTLIDTVGNIPETTKDSIFRLKELGHEIVLPTGRPPFMFEEIRNELDIHSYISFNGQLVVLRDEIVYSNPLDSEALEQLTMAAQKNNHPIIHISMEGMGSSVTQHEYITESLKSLHLTVETTYDPHYYRSREILQSMLFLSENEEGHYKEELFKDLKFVRWHPLSVDIDPLGGSKAKGIEIMMEHLGYTKDQLVAFGDGLNDIDMLSFVPNSVAMGNADVIVKNAARFITKPVDQDGIYHGLKLIGLL
ncbi:MAG: Cof-type HAD-IIB family hydrolase [Heyndrickxia sp.]